MSGDDEMIILVESRSEVAEAFISCFAREGVAAEAIKPDEIVYWCAASYGQDLVGVEGIIFGLVAARVPLARDVKVVSGRPMIALTERRSLYEMLDLFAHGIDDVVEKPVHVRKLLARLRVISGRRADYSMRAEAVQDIILSDWRVTIVGEAPLVMPRKGRRLIECLVSARWAWRTKTQVFNFVYRPFSSDYDECLVECHVSRLRKRLRERLGHDVIESQRYLGNRVRESVLRNESATELLPAMPECGPRAQRP
jgi:two-component system, OmpR family, flagellar system response regulator FtcR